MNIIICFWVFSNTINVKEDNFLHSEHHEYWEVKNSDKVTFLGTFRRIPNYIAPHLLQK